MVNKNKDNDNFDDIDFDNDQMDEGYISELDEEDFGDEESFDDEDSNLQQNKKSKMSSQSGKKALSFNTMVMIGAFVLGAGVLVFNVMGQTKKQAQAVGDTFTSSMNIADVMDGNLTAIKPQTPQDVKNEPTEPVQNNQGFLGNDPQSIPQDAPKLETLPQPSPIVSEGTEPSVVTPLPNDAEVNSQSQDVSTTKPESMNNAEDLLKNAIANRNKPDGAKEENQISQFPKPTLPDAKMDVQEEAVATPVIKNQETEKTDIPQDLSQKLDQILSRMDKMETDLVDIRTESSQKYQDLEKSVLAMKNEMTSIESKPVVEKQMEPSAKPAKALPVKKKTSSKPASSKPKQATKNVAWELRAAQPGRAWISKMGEKDMQSVQVGQTIQGIGQIQAITYQNGLWTIIGTQGKISQ